jgi:taurine--2-oxoglutarate transaminase
MVDKVGAELFKRGVTCQTWVSHFVIAPPLIINKEQLDFGLNAFDEALKVADAEVEN